MRQLWPHQEEALTALRQSVAQGVRRIVLSSPTGSGKTLLASSIVNSALQKNKRVAFVVSNLSLIDQSVEAFYREGVRDVGVIQSNHISTDWARPIQVCSIQTLKNREAYPRADVVIIDEAHVLHETHKKWLQDPAWQSVPFIGLTATPGTRGLGKYFQTLLTVSTTKELIDAGILSPFKVFATGHPDLKNVKIVAGDYHEKQLSDAMQQGNLTADIVATWKERWGKNKTLCYGVDCAHAEMIKERFLAAGITCGYQDARTPADQRREIKKKFHNGEYQVVTNVGTLTTGTDWDVRCLILARPTKSEMLYQQIIGRALRIAEGKDHALILDHSDTTERLGFVTDIHWDQLDDGKPKPKPVIKPKARLPRECPKCTAIVNATLKVCPNCGNDLKIISGLIERDGQLIEVTAGERKQKFSKRRIYSQGEKLIWFASLKWYGGSKGYKPGWASNQFKEKFGHWPNGIDPNPMEPEPDVLGWIKSRQISWAMRKRKEASCANAGSI